MKSTAWLYLVVSTSRQAETLGEQEAWARATATAEGWTITRTFQGTASGKNGPRKLVQDLLTQLRGATPAARPARVLMTRLDRVGRGETLQVLVAIDEILRLGATIHTREDGDVVIQRSSDIIKPFFRALTGGLENEARADKARAGHARRKTAGLHDGNAPYGVVLISGRPRASEPAASVVRTIFKLRAQGFGIRKIGKAIQQDSPAPKTLKNGQTKHLTWDKSTIAQMLRCKTYRGVVVDEALFDLVSSVRQPAPNFVKSSEGVWPLAGAVRCSCGRKLSGRMSGKKTSRHRYYVCYEHEKSVPHFRAEFLEAAFLQMLDQLIASPELQRTYRSPKIFAGAMRERVHDLERALRDLDQRRKNVLGHAEMLSPSSESTGALFAHLDELGTRRLRLERELQTAKGELAQAEALRRQTAGAAELLASLPTLWPTLADDDQRELARLFSNMLGGIRLAEGCRSRSVQFAPPDTSLNSVHVYLHT